MASKALMKKSTDRSLHYTGSTIIETALESNESMKQVIHTHTHTHSVSISIKG